MPGEQEWGRSESGEEKQVQEGGEKDPASHRFRRKHNMFLSISRRGSEKGPKEALLSREKFEREEKERISLRGPLFICPPTSKLGH